MPATACLVPRPSSVRYATFARTSASTENMVSVFGRVSVASSAGGEQQSVATPHTARGWTCPPCRHFNIQSCCCLGPAFEAKPSQVVLLCRRRSLRAALRSLSYIRLWTVVLLCSVARAAEPLHDLYSVRRHRDQVWEASRVDVSVRPHSLAIRWWVSDVGFFGLGYPVAVFGLLELLRVCIG
jgi:hypothetical protein